jgi:hypothetical protein
VSAGGLRWGTGKRLEFIDSRLFWDGVVSCQELAGIFGISLQQASADFARYLEMAPGNAVCNRSENGYVRSETFSPKLTTPDSVRQIAHLRLMAEGIVRKGFGGFGQAPSFDVVPGPARRIDPPVLRAILDAIRRWQEIEITYQAMSRPETERRWTAPHALAFDGFRWHARARCVRDGAFKDFVLARMSSTGDRRPSAIDPHADKAWHQSVRTIIGPHPGLSAGQRKAVEAGYGMTGGVSVIDVRASFLWYFLKGFGIEGDAVAKSPQDPHIVLLSREDVMASLSSRQEA